MKPTQSRKTLKTEAWPRKVRVGRESVTVYRRWTPGGTFAFMVSNYAEGKRRFDCYPSEAEALEAASDLARKLSERDVVAAALTNEQASEYAASVQALAPFSVPVLSAARIVADCLPVLGGKLSSMVPAAQDYAKRNPTNLPKVSTAAAVAQFLESKRKDGLRDRSIGDLETRLNRFASDCQMDLAQVTSPRLSDWLDSLKVGPQTRLNYRRVLNTFFGWAESKEYIMRGENPVARLPELRVLRDQSITIFTPEQLRTLLTYAEGEFQAVVAFMAFAGLRPEEVQRLDWKDVNLAEGLVHVTGRSAKTRTHRHAPVFEPLRAWLAPHVKPSGKVWTGTANEFTVARRRTVRASGVKWHQDGLRHSWISCRLAIVNDTARVAVEAGNTEDVIVRHYRHLRTERQGKAWFDVLPTQPANVVSMPSQAVA